jgi:probable phosphoglycerate mutase
MPTTRCLLVRHGQSEWNAAGRWQGQADPPLSDLGRHQAHTAAAAVGTVDAIVASDLQRAAETAAIVAGAIGVGPVVIDADWRERDAGEWSGLTRAEIDEQWPGYLPESRHGAFAPSEHRRPPSWEPDDVLLRRVLAALARVHDLVGDGDALVVTHGGVVYTLEQHLGATFERMANLEGRWLDVTGDKLVLGERVHLVDPHDETVPAQL